VLLFLHVPMCSLAILSHLYISLHLPHLSTSLLTSPSTTSFTSDSLLSQLLIARSNLATGPSAKYQDAYYVFEEIKGMQGGRGESVLGGVSVAQALLGRWEEARDATNEALEMVRPRLSFVFAARACSCGTRFSRSGFAGASCAGVRSTDSRNPTCTQNPTHPTSLANSAALALHTGKPDAAAQEILACVQLSA